MPNIEQNIVSMAGRLCDQKNFTPLLNQLNFDKTKDLRIIIAGEGHLRRKLEKDYEDLIKESSLILKGNIKDIDKFLSALDKVLKIEKETIRKFDTVNNSKLELILNPFVKKDTVSEIDQSITNFESYYLLEEADADEALEYFINLEVSNFSNEYSRKQGLESEPPF